MNLPTQQSKGPVICPFQFCDRSRSRLLGAAFLIAAVFALIVGAPRAYAQISTVVFSDDFAANTIDTNKYQPDAPFFEGGLGTIGAVPGSGVMQFTGSTTQQWWSGATLRVVPTFNPSEAANVAVSIDRVAEAGQAISRSALWILDETRTKYVLFADVDGEGGWRYNRKIGETGDVPTGSGTDIAAFNGGTFDDLGLHRMKMIADGKTVKLFLDGQLGAEVRFPFSPVIFEFGSYARANNDTADTTWDNLKIETIRQSVVVFSDDFSSNTIDTNKFQPDAPFFEGGLGTIHAVAGGGVMQFVGSTTQQWWSGATLRVVPTFTASDEATVAASIDRVAEAGQAISRSALWILDETRTKYVLFADVDGEGGWRYNRKIGETGDVPTGSGTDIAAFNGGTFDDLGLHRMGMVHDGKTVKLFLDGELGAEVKFPFSTVIFEFGSYARANNDTADTTWDNIRIETAGAATFSPTVLSVRTNQTSGDITLRIPPGLNAQAPVIVQVVSSDPNVAVPVGGTGAVLNVTFPAGGTNLATFRVRGLSLGGAQFRAQGGLAAGNELSVSVISGPGVLLDEIFGNAAIDSSKWQVSNRGFESGAGTFVVTQDGGGLEISGTVSSDFWPGASLKTVRSYVATEDLNLLFEVDRVSLEQTGTGGRTGVYITTGDRSRFVFFGQNTENNWQVNVNPGNPTGGGTVLAAFAGVTDTSLHRLRLLADGETVEVFLDGQSGGRFPFAVTTGIFFEIGSYARASTDTVKGIFDNARIENVLPCLNLSPTEGISITIAESGRTGTVTVPALLYDAAPASITITSSNRNIAVPTGAVNGVLTLTFAPGSANSRAFAITPVGLGSTVFGVGSTQAVCVSGLLNVSVVAVPQLLLADDFSGNAFDPAKWMQDSTPFDTGTPTPESAIIVSNGQAKIDVTVGSVLWPGLALFMTTNFSASPTNPATFEIDRTKLEFVLTTGTDSEQRTGIWVKDGAGNFVFFDDHVAHNGRNFGWRYNKRTGEPDDNPTGDGVNIPAFDGPGFNDQLNHHMKMVVNGLTARLSLDGLFGVELPFPFSEGLTFGFGAYVDDLGNVVRGYFDNARITGGSAAVGGRLTAIRQGANIVISWTGPGVLQSTDTLSPPNWQDVTPAPVGTSLTIAASQTGKRFYRLR